MSKTKLDLSKLEYYPKVDDGMTVIFDYAVNPPYIAVSKVYKKDGLIIHEQIKPEKA